MSDDAIISDIGETLITLLRENMADLIDQNDPELIILFSPGEFIAADHPRLMLFLYGIRENEHLKNKPIQNQDHTLSSYPPLTVDLFYMLTPFPSEQISDKTDRTKDVHRILGRAMQIFYDNSILKGSRLKGGLTSTDVELRLLQTSLPLEEQAQIWNSLGDDALYRLSVFYVVTPVEIDSKREIEARRVVEKVS